MSLCNHPQLLTLPELITAKRKLGVAAAFFDKDKMSTGGFTSETLNPTEFKSQLRLNFAVELTSKELGAVVTWFDSLGNRTVDTKQFLFKFFLLGEEERKRRKYNYKLKEERIGQLNQKIKKQKEHFVEQLKKSKVTDKFTEKDEKSAIQKMAKIAMTYDHEEPSLHEFTMVTSLAPVEFREIMKRNCLVTFTPPELGALVRLFDKDGSNRIDTTLFLHHFYTIGRKERDDKLNQSTRIAQRKREEEQQRKKAISDKYGKLIEAKVEPASDADRISADEKIRVAAAYFTKEKAFPINIGKCFESQGLSPTQFRELLKNNFQIFLTPGELDAAMRMFDTDGDGSISCVEFLTNFFALGSREKSRIFEEKRLKDERLLREKEERMRKKVEAMERLNVTAVEWPELPELDETFATPLNSPARSISKKSSAARLPATIEEDEVLLPSEAGDTPVLQQSLNTSAFVDSTTLFNTSANGPPQRQSLTSPPRRRKPSVVEMISPDPITQLLLKKCRAKKGKGKGKSTSELFPKISEATKDFLLEIEDEERLIEKLRSKRKNGKKMNRSASAGAVRKPKANEPAEMQQRPYSAGVNGGTSTSSSGSSSSKFKSSLAAAINDASQETPSDGINTKAGIAAVADTADADATANEGVYEDISESPAKPLAPPQAEESGSDAYEDEAYEDDADFN